MEELNFKSAKELFENLEASRIAMNMYRKELEAQIESWSTEAVDFILGEPNILSFGLIRDNETIQKFFGEFSDEIIDFVETNNNPENRIFFYTRFKNAEDTTPQIYPYYWFFYMAETKEYFIDILDYKIKEGEKYFASFKKQFLFRLIVEDIIEGLTD